MVLADFLHGLFVLATTGTYALPIVEGFQRKSPFYVILFTTLCIFSFALHCEETGLCAPLGTKLHSRLQTVDLALSYYLMNVMLLVVLEIRAEVLGRIVAGLVVTVIAFRDVLDLKFNLAICLAFGAGMLVADIVRFKRKFSAAWWRRLALIGGMAAIGAILFRLLKLLWAWHGIWHVYYVATCYLLLLAQRHKRTASVTRPGTSAGHLGSSMGRSTATTDFLSTPLKRKAAPTTESGVATSTAAEENENHDVV